MQEKIVIDTTLPEGKTPELLIVFSHPNRTDLTEGKLADKEGSLDDEITSALKDAGFEDSQVHYTTMVKTGIGPKPKPTAEDIALWAEALDKEIEQIKPRLIMAMGAEVFKRLMKTNIKMTDYIGEIIDCPYGKLLVNYSPKMISINDPTKRPEFRDNFMLAKKFLNNMLNYEEYRYIVIDNPEDNIKVLRRYIKNNQLTIGYDAEWFGEKFTDDEVMYEFQYCCEPNVAIILNISKDGVTENRELLDTMKLILERDDVKRMGWNIRADDLRLRLRGFNLLDETLAFDGMKAVAFLDSRMSKGLETGIKHFTNYPPYYNQLNKKLREHKLAKHEMAKMKFADPDVYYNYCAGDAVSHRAACLSMQEHMPANLRKLYYEVYLPLTHYFTDMEFTGIPVDMEVLEDITSKYYKKYQELKTELIEFLKTRYGIEEFNPNSSQQKKDLLFKTLKVQPAYYTKAGKSPRSRAWYDGQKSATKALYEPSTNSKSLSTIKFELEDTIRNNPDLPELKDTCKVVELLLNVSRVGVFATKFLSKKGIAQATEENSAESEADEEPLKQSYWSAVCEDGKIHASFFECLKNFRASSSPNVQNPASKVLAYIPDIFIPGYSDLDKEQQKEKEHLLPSNIRNIFYSGHPDFYWTELDVAGADLAIMAFLSKDKDFIKDIRSGSFHQTKMREYFKDPTLSKHDVSKYVISKSITFRVSYTSSLSAAALPIQADIYAENGLRVELDTVEYALKTWERYKRYMHFREKCLEEVKVCNRITNARGLELSYENTDNSSILAGWLNESLAFPVASELAWFMWEASVNLKKRLKQDGVWMKYVYPVNTVHDAGYWLVYKDLIKDNYMQEVLKYVFCHQTKLATGDNVGCELSVSDRWKGKQKIFDNETVWNFETNQWQWKH
jgi:uracil-DNA glycosylase family 4